jgi:hypothetical protein
MAVYNLSCINFYKNSDDDSQLQPKQVAVIKLTKTILTYVPCILHSLLSRPTNAQHILIIFYIL